MKKIIEAFNHKPLVELNGYKFVVNPLTEQIPYTKAKLLRQACRALVAQVDRGRTTKLVSEEDKGAIFLAGVSLITGLPFGMARWQPNGLSDQIRQSFKMEYHGGFLYLSGVEKNDRVTIIEDLISTGGTLISLIKMVKQAGAEIVDVVCLAEKVNYKGVRRVKAETGCVVKTLVKIDISGKYSKAVNK